MQSLCLMKAGLWCVYVYECVLHVLTILTGQMLSLSISFLCDWFTADKQTNKSQWACTVPLLSDTQTNCLPQAFFLLLTSPLQIHTILHSAVRFLKWPQNLRKPRKTQNRITDGALSNVKVYYINVLEGNTVLVNYPRADSGVLEVSMDTADRLEACVQF